MPSLPSLTELGLLQSTPYASYTPYAPYWTTLDGEADSVSADAVSADVSPDAVAPDVLFFGRHRLDHPRKRRAVSPDDQHKPTLSVHIPDDEDVPELEAEAESDSSPDSSPSSPGSSPESSPEPAPADLALPIRRLMPHYLLPLPVSKQQKEQQKEQQQEQREKEKDPRETKRKRAPSLAHLLAPTPNVYCLYKLDRVDQLGGKRRGMRW